MSMPRHTVKHTTLARYRARFLDFYGFESPLDNTYLTELWLETRSACMNEHGAYRIPSSKVKAHMLNLMREATRAPEGF